MAINFSNVNISLQQFQELSSGEHNAGEVHLVDEHTIGKVNNFVFRKYRNTVVLPQEEVLAIKNAFVKALSSSGVGGDELNRVRKELGLASANPVDSRLHERSIKPLTRQQIREILDRNAAAINEQLGDGTVRTSAQIYAGVDDKTSKARSRLRNEANAERTDPGTVHVADTKRFLQQMVELDVRDAPPNEKLAVQNLHDQIMNDVHAREIEQTETMTNAQIVEMVENVIRDNPQDFPLLTKYYLNAV